MAALEEFCSMSVTMEFQVIGSVPAGTRIDIPFSGVATSAHWEGERPVNGIDYVTIRGDGNMDLDLRARIGEGRGMVAYKGSGVSIVPERGVAEPRETLTFQTADEDFDYLNRSVGVAVGRGEGPDLSLTIYLVAP